MEVAKGLQVSLTQGHVLISYDVKAVLQPALDKLKAKVVSGEIDLVKGSNVDTMLILMVIDAVSKELAK